MKPMLAGKCDLARQRYPVLASHKLDGVRALVKDGVLLTRSLKPIPNRYAQAMFSKLPEGTDGELIVGDPTAKNAYRQTVSAVMSEDGADTELRFHVFDNFRVGGGFNDRFELLKAIFNDVGPKKLERFHRTVLVKHTLIGNEAELLELEAQALEAGHEGLIIRSLSGPYKFGRSSTNEGYMLKVKRFVDGEATVVGTEELLHNGNVATTNPLGHTERSTHQVNLRPTGTLGSLEVQDLVTGVTFNVGTGFDQEDREKLWRVRRSLIGRICKYKHFPIGAKDKPRHPVFIGWRDERDMSSSKGE